MALDKDGLWYKNDLVIEEKADKAQLTGVDVKIEDVLVIRTRENITKTAFLSWLKSHKNTDVRKILESKELCEHLNIQEQDIARLQQGEQS